MSTPSKFAAAMQTYETIVAAERADPTIDPRCVSLVLQHGSTVERAIVLFHGFTNCPRQFAEFAELVFEAGYNVYVPRLPRHGLRDKLTTILDLLTLEELTACATDSTQLAGGLGRTVSVLGLSVGATLAAWLTQTHTLEHTIAIAPFFSMAHVSTTFEPLIGGALALAPNAELWWDPRVKERAPPEHAYPRFSTHALAQCLQLGATVRDEARAAPPRALRSTLLLNAHDPAIDNAAASEVWRLWRVQGGAVDEYVFKNLDQRHDIIEPQTYPQARTLVYPVLLRLLAS